MAVRIDAIKPDIRERVHVGVEERLLAVTPRVWLPPNPEVAVVHELRHVRVWRREGLVGHATTASNHHE
eukprot:CAMPEP_0205814786 /NCGR_PEP_ID=MMETSP0205-20121125/20141_1 /ASSEMBLY_ACC=CAM_ASM_000278 /TAXON_ID=36767 /ORGANISM="Euplotes focardii, Strain TN1" /LENGTH=68 /DNA_ID=CAMNT_0053099615 /DNA_START=142 /DNA_END=348 /DNA_ORIENTATION=-